MTTASVDENDTISFIASLRQRQSEISEALAQRFINGAPVAALMRDRASLIDQLLVDLWRHFKLQQETVSLIAVGGYGRGELHPHSDIDLLILLADDYQPSEALQQFLTALWDIGLNIGHSVRTAEECATLAAEDITIITTLMETRLLFGDENHYTHLATLVTPEQIWDTQKFYGAKWEEQIVRHRKFSNTEYSLEPNLKDGPGGLRDIQILGWLALRRFGTSDFDELAKIGFLTADEANLLNKERDYLWKVRWELHTLTGREEDRLLFDHQLQLAAKNQLEDTDKQLAVEQYMQAYYKATIVLSSLNELVMQAFEESIWENFTQAVPQAINERFHIRDRHLEQIDDNLFTENPSAILEAFVILAEEPNIIGTTASCTRAIRSARRLIDDNFRENPVNKQLFIRLLRAPHKVATQLRRMNQQDILPRYIKKWGDIVGKMQHDLFHIYTVDAHTIQVVKNLRLLTYKDAEREYPLGAQIIKQLPAFDLLYIAGLFHDIGKGRGGDHSELGAVDAREFCESHGYDETETALVVFLVRNHLLMSGTSQRKDISDPDVIKEFALVVGNVNYLNYLFVLTVADINATNPTMWTSWRASLMRQLYAETRRALRRGLEETGDRDARVESTRRMATYILHQNNYTDTEIEAAWNNPGDDYFIRENAADIAWQTEAIINHRDGPLIIIKDTDSRRLEGATQIFIYTNDTHKLFSRTTNLLAQLNLNVQDARIYSNDRGYSLDTYIVLDADDQPIGDDPEKIAVVKDSLIAGLNDESLISDGQHIRVPRALQHFSYPTQVRFEQDAAKNQTIIEVISPDRAGLLAAVAGVFTQFNIEILAAKVSTLGERVEDVFFVADANGAPIEDLSQQDAIAEAIKNALDLKDNE